MEFGVVVSLAFLLLVFVFFIWCCIGLVKIVFRAMTSPWFSASPVRDRVRYPAGADEPDGSSYSEVNGEVRLD